MITVSTRSVITDLLASLKSPIERHQDRPPSGIYDWQERSSRSHGVHADSERGLYSCHSNAAWMSLAFPLQLWRASPRGDVDLSIAASLFSAVEGDDNFGDIINGKVSSLPVDKVRSWLKRMSITPETNTRGAVFLNGQYQPLDEVRSIQYDGLQTSE